MSKKDILFTEPTISIPEIGDVSHFVVNFNDSLKSKSNFRYAKKGWSSLKEFEKLVSLEVSRAIPEEWDIGKSVTKLKDRPKVVCSLIAYGKIDNGNLNKSIFDSLEGLVYINDASIVSSSSISASRTGHGFSIGFALLPNNVSISSIIKVQNSLSVKVLESFNLLDVN